MSRFIAFLYGLVSYFVFFGTILYAICFVEGLLVPKAIDSGAVVPLAEALTVNVLLMSVFAVQHSVMARRQFKEWWTQFVPKSVERSTYVLLASLALVLLFWQWRPIPAVVWQVADPQTATAIMALSLVGWVLVFTSTFLINHFELFGLHQVANNLVGRPMPAVRFKTPVLYKVVRHPIYLGFIIAFWAAPTMTVGHLLFAAVTTAYIFVGIFLEERDLIEMFGDEYRRYRRRVAMIVPFLGAATAPAEKPVDTGTASVLLACRNGRDFGARAARSQGDRRGGARADRQVWQPCRDVAGGPRAARQHHHLDREPAA
jgi:protein-S-isoprenylcysteine O-methyltransferase Ste14